MGRIATLTEPCEDSWAVAGYIRAMADSSLPLTVQEASGRVRLCLGGLAHDDGPTLQDAADDLVQRLLSYAMAFRASGFRGPSGAGATRPGRHRLPL
jgi:hypothetical protein